MKNKISEKAGMWARAGEGENEIEFKREEEGLLEGGRKRARANAKELDEERMRGRERNIEIEEESRRGEG